MQAPPRMRSHAVMGAEPMTGIRYHSLSAAVEGRPYGRMTGWAQEAFRLQRAEEHDRPGQGDHASLRVI